MTDSYYLPFGPEVKLNKPFGVKPVDEWNAPAGEPIRAAGDGVVVFAGPVEDRFYVDNFTKNLDYSGDVVVLKMNGPIGPFFEYRNPSEIEVNANDRVEGGQIIALAGEENVHVGALPWRFNLSSRNRGRVNPRLYQNTYFGSPITSGAETEDTPVIPVVVEEQPAPSKRKRGSRAADPVITDSPEPQPVDGTVPNEGSETPPVDAFSFTDVAAPSEPVDSVPSTEE
jgi:hypothetical protein